jgi:uncharacterized protein DUF4232
MTPNQATNNVAQPGMAAWAGGAGRALVAVALLAMASCASPSVVASPPKSFVPWEPLPAAHHYVNPEQDLPAAPSVPAGTPPCSAAQLEGVGLAGSAAAGNVDWPLLLRNKGASDCFLQGFVDVTVLDRREHELAKAVGATGRGTFFSDGPADPVLMAHGTPALPSPFQERDGSVGQAFMNFSWYDCQPPFAATLAIGIPDGAGTFRIPYATQASENPMCPSTYRSISRGPLSPAGNVWPFVKVDVSLSGPSVAKPGTRITYYVTLRNTGNRDYDLKPCPDYSEGFNGKQFLVEYQLNCGSVSTLKPGAQVTFEMQFEVPKEVSPGTRDLSWYLSDGRLDGGAGALTPLRII